MPIEHTPSEARTIERIKLDSSNLASAGYDEARQILAIEFASSGLVLHYDGFPPEKFGEFAAAESRGRYYAKEIRGKYPARTMTGMCRCGAKGYIGERCDVCNKSTVREVDRQHGK